MPDPILALNALLAPVFGDTDPVVRPSDRADFQANGVLALAKQLGRNPRELAAEMLAQLDLAGVATAEVAGPGFINLTLDDAWIAAQATTLGDDERLGLRVAEHPERVVVDYSAPNVAKEMHVGHLRSTVIGDSLVRLLTAVGHHVIRENHVGDWGTPMGLLMEHMADLGPDETARQLAHGDLTAFYRAARAKFDGDGSDEFKMRTQQRVVALQAGDPETVALWTQLAQQSGAEMQVMYDRLGVLLTVDDIVGESFYNPMLADVVTDLDTLGLLEESDGAGVVFPPGFKNRDDEPLPLIVRNSQGGYNYATSDLACVRDRVGRLNATWLIYVVGAPQAQHLTMVWEVAKMAGWLQPPARAVHVPFGSVLGEDKKMLRTRSGDTFRLEELIDEAIERAEAKIIEKNPGITGDERVNVARAVGIGSIKYADLSSDRVKDYVFAWDRMVAFEGNTAGYLQYAHARTRSILRRAADAGHVIGGRVLVAAPQERALALSLLGFDAAVHDTIDKLGPHRLCTYLFDLAQTLTSFYDACPVLRDDVDPDLRDSRLMLCDLTAKVLARGLGLLGIEAPERM
jgi:arginyl-tRNA synthetase